MPAMMVSSPTAARSAPRICGMSLWASANPSATQVWFITPLAAHLLTSLPPMSMVMSATLERCAWINASAAWSWEPSGYVHWLPTPVIIEVVVDVTLVGLDTLPQRYSWRQQRCRGLHSLSEGVTKREVVLGRRPAVCRGGRRGGSTSEHSHNSGRAAQEPE